MRGRNGSMLEGDERHGNGQQAAFSRMRSYALTIGIVGPFLPMGVDFQLSYGEVVILYS